MGPAMKDSFSEQLRFIDFGAQDLGFLVRGYSGISEFLRVGADCFGFNVLGRMAAFLGGKWGARISCHVNHR